jgi:hypothetical protein
LNSSVSLPMVATTAIAVRAVPSLTYSACMARREWPDARSSSDEVCMANRAVDAHHHEHQQGDQHHQTVLTGDRVTEARSRVLRVAH